MRSDGLPSQAHYEQGAARVLGPDGSVAGAGFLIGDRLVCTCAHVVQEREGGRPRGPVTVDFPLLAGAGACPPVTAGVESWRPEDDIAILRLDTPVDGTEPLPLVTDGSDEWGGEVRSFGFPLDAPRGVNATGVLRGRQRADRLQLDLAAHGVPITQGFSGAAVWDVRGGAVVGMLVTRGRYGLSGTAYLIPADRLIGADVRVECPFRGLGRFEEDDARYFHGRGPDVQALGEALGSRPVTVLAGPSGSGKSSLLRAGLLADLRRRGTPTALRVPQPPADPATAASEHADAWVAEAVAAVWHAAVPDHAARQERLNALREACAGPEGARLALRGRLRDELGPKGAVLLLDQFEEYAAAAPHGALRIFRTLSALTAAPDPAQGGGLRVALTARPATLEALTAADTSAALSRAVTFLAPMTPEALALAVDEPVRAVPGLHLQAGLSARLVRDAVGEPGCLPLLQFALTELWKRKKAHTLTHAAYEEIGGVGGALKTYAEQALASCLTQNDVPADTARRLFQRLARPDGRDGFTRRSVPIDQLSPEQARLARALAACRLLVWDVVESAEHGQAGGTVHVVHEALLCEWPRLADWLRDGATFRDWQERTARDAAEWDSRARAAGLLPHGVRLAQGLEWLARRPEDLTALERDYLEAGRRRERRGLRRLWAVTGLVTVLALLTAGLAANSVSELRRNQEQLRIAASTELGELAGETADQSPDSAFRYAAGAWTAWHTPEARRALFAQYVRAHDTVWSRSGLWPGTVESAHSSLDGGTLLVVSRPHGSSNLAFTAVTDTLGDAPRTRRLRGVPESLDLEGFQDELSDDGLQYALATTEGKTLLWNLGDPDPAPRLLSEPLADRGKVYATPVVDFSEDGRRLLHFFQFQTPRPEDTGRHALARLWDTRTGKALPLSQRSMALYQPDTAWLLGRGDRIAVGISHQVRGGKDPAWEHYLDLHDTASGERLRRVLGPVEKKWMTSMDRGRAILLNSEHGTSWHALAPGAARPGVNLKASLFFTDMTGTHFLDSRTTTGAGIRTITLLDARQKPRYWATVLPNEVASSTAQHIAVSGSGPGPRTVLAVVGDSLLRMRPVPIPQPPSGASTYSTGVQFAVSPDGSRVARLSQGRLEVVGPGGRIGATRQVLSDKARKRGDLSLHLLWVAREDGDAVLVWSHSFHDAALFDVSTLRTRKRVVWDCGRGGGKLWNNPQDIVQTPGGDLVVLCLGDTLVRVDPRSGVRTGGPLHLERDPQEPGSFSPTGQLLPRPGHRDEVAVVTDDWADHGRIEVWDVRRGTRTARLPGPPLLYTSELPRRWMTFSADGDRLAALGLNHRVQWWRVDDEKKDEETRPLPDADGLLGIAPDGTLVTLSSSTVSLFSPSNGEPLGHLTWPTHSSLNAGHLTKNSLRLLSDVDDLTLHLSPTHWHDTICSAAPGPYTPTQRTAPRLKLARETAPCPAS
ncbi:trypsin-like peptidase domain-containing protein [Streptomyces sp. NPDC051677]|uniref:nSTAND1 domain-containing NTPase n=1 Tax=Streptomyces sp. NPDC051677 TaxID=3365669 RepID=UPI0037D1E040